MLTQSVTTKMIAFYEGRLHDIEHFLKVHAYAALIGRLEGLEEELQTTLELTAIVHDISCPMLRDKYGSADGKHQEAESEPLLREFLAEFCFDPDRLERIIFLVAHHHTVTDVTGIDWQILLEADFLVNASEHEIPKENIRHFRNNVAKTAAGKALLDSVYQL